jgi:hypothetical protein
MRRIGFMKKLIAISVVFALIAGAAFAQTASGISVNAWGRGVFAPLMNVGAEKADGKVVKDEETGKDLESSNYAGAGVTWGGSLPRTDFRVNGDAEFIGFTVNLTEDGVNGGDNVYIWAKPFSNDILKLYVGKFDVDNLRGKVDTDTGFENFVAGDMSADKIFWRFRAAGGDPNGFGANSGFMLSSAPTDGLFIGLRVNGNLFRNWSGDGSGNKLLDAYRFLQFGAGYDIPDVGLLRAQWIGGWFGTVTSDKLEKDFEIGPSLDKTARIEAAFALTAIQNLTLDLGFKFWLPLKFDGSDAKATNGLEVGLGARFRADAFQIVAQIHSTFASYDRADADDKSANGLGLKVNLIPTYDLDAFTLGASIGLEVGGKSKDINGDAVDNSNSMKVGFGAFAQKGLGSGSVKAGVAYKVAPSYGGKAYGSNVLSIPIILEYAFF